jgi:hypothetical protein
MFETVAALEVPSAKQMTEAFLTQALVSVGLAAPQSSRTRNAPDVDDVDDVDAVDETFEDVPAVSRKSAPRVRSKRNRPRSKTIALKRLTREELRRGALANPPVEGAQRPQTRAECKDMPRPCPWVACKHHLYLDINPMTGSIKINFPDLEPWELQHTCALDVADNGGLTLEEIGLITNLTRERVRQLEVRGLFVLKLNSKTLR